jgi:aminopeptidase I
MVRHTPDFLRSRSSNLSLRTSSAQSNPAQQPGPSAPMARSEAASSQTNDEDVSRTAFFLATGGAEQPRLAVVTICHGCVARLGSYPPVRIIQPTSSQENCKICGLAAGKPEAFTWPFCDFLTENPTVFHAVDYFKRAARVSGYTEVRQCYCECAL